MVRPKSNSRGGLGKKRAEALREFTAIEAARPAFAIVRGALDPLLSYLPGCSRALYIGTSAPARSALLFVPPKSNRRWNAGA